MFLWGREVQWGPYGVGSFGLALYFLPQTPSETEAKALLKERQKKDNHNLSEQEAWGRLWVWVEGRHTCYGAHTFPFYPSRAAPTLQHQRPHQGVGDPHPKIQ